MKSAACPQVSESLGMRCTRVHLPYCVFKQAHNYSFQCAVLKICNSSAMVLGSVRCSRSMT